MIYHSLQNQQNNTLRRVRANASTEYLYQLFFSITKVDMKISYCNMVEVWRIKKPWHEIKFLIPRASDSSHIKQLNCYTLSA